jgi:Rhs family protein
MLSLAICANASQVLADTPAFREFRADVLDGPTFYSRDVKEAGAVLMDGYCRQQKLSACALTSTSVGSQMYFVNFFFEYANGGKGSTTWVGTMVYSCDVPGALHVVRGDQTWGPYENRSLPAPTWGTAVCRGGQAIPNIRANLGPGDCKTRPNAGNPINIGTSNKFQEVLDIPLRGASPLTWSRFYNSGMITSDETRHGEPADVVPDLSRMGNRWRGFYDRVVDGADNGSVRLTRHTGEQFDFIETAGRYVATTDPRGRLLRDATGWTYHPSSGGIERYDLQGRLTDLDAGTRNHVHLEYGDALLTAIDSQGRSFAFAYDEAGRLIRISDEAGVVVTYRYSDSHSREANLVGVEYADGTAQRYAYNEKGFVTTDLPHVLTGIFDETGTRFASFRYDATGRATTSEHSNGIDRFSLVSESDGSVSVNDPMNTTRRYRYASVRGVRRLVGVDQPGGAGCGAAFSKLEYDDNGSLTRVTDFDGRATEFTYDQDGRETSRTEAAGTPLARTIRTEWHATLMLPTRVSQAGREERLAYDEAGNLVRRELWAAIDPSQKDALLTLSRVWKFTYDADGRLLQEDGPRSDTPGAAALMRYTYRAAAAANCASGSSCDYRKGDLATIENALGHKEEILRFDAAGRVLARRLPNGTLVEHVYSPRGWLLTIRETGADGLVATSEFGYDERGEITSITDADGVKLAFEYDAAGRLVRMSNPSNHKLIVDRDKAGRPVTETAYDSFFEKMKLRRTFDALGRVATEQGQDAGLMSFTYDEVGRPTGVTNGDGLRSRSSFDVLGRLMEAVDDLDGKRSTIKMSYDSLDQVTNVEDADGVKTAYLTTGMGDLAHVDSPDGGESYDEYDPAGRVSRHEGPAGVGSFSVARDALGRPVKLSYADASLDTTFLYDVPDTSCPGDKRNGVGALSAMRAADGETLFCYDSAGNVARKVQQRGPVRKTLSYAYTRAHRLASMAVEGGATILYSYDIDGKIGAVSVDMGGRREQLVTKVAYRPFDAIESWTYGNGWTFSNNRDKAGRLTSWGGIDPKGSNYWLDPSPGGLLRADVTRPYGYAFSYDGLNYLNEVRDYNTGNGLLAFAYNASGDRLSITDRDATNTYAYQPGTHRLTRADGKARQYDAAGNLIALGNATLAYDATGRLASAREQGKLLVSYGYDGSGNRIARSVAATGKTMLSLYDEAGRWVADYDEGGKVIQQVAWMRDMPIGIVDSGKLYYLAPDHLGSAREVLDPTRNVLVWHWYRSADPFGSTAPEEDPDGDGRPFVLDMRLPGQRYDSLTGLHANGARDYDPHTGRYVQADPIGLAGGINPYVYASGSPFTYGDPTGLIRWEGYVSVRSASLGIGVGAYEFGLRSECRSGRRAYALVKAAGFGAGLNIKFAPPVSGTISPIELEDRLDHIDPNVFNGWFSTWSAGAAYHFGYSASIYQLGGNGRYLTKPENAGAWAKPSAGSERGIELGVGGIAGRSRVIGHEWSSCGCEGGQ